MLRPAATRTARGARAALARTRGAEGAAREVSAERRAWANEKGAPRLGASWDLLARTAPTSTWVLPAPARSAAATARTSCVTNSVAGAPAGPKARGIDAWMLAASSVPTVPSPLQVVQAGLFSLHSVLGGPWWFTIVSGTMLLRTSLVPVTIWQMKMTRRMLGGRVAGHMQHLGKLFTKELQDPASNRMRLARLYVQGARAIFRKFRVQPLALVAVPLTQIATLLTFVYATRNLVTHGALDLSTEGALWFTDLSAKDSTTILPLVAVTLSYTALERSFGRTVQVPGQPISLTAGDVVRELLQTMLIFGFPFIAQLPSGIFMYWIPSSAFGVAQNLVLRLPSVRAALGIMDPPRLNVTPIVKQVPKSAVVSPHRPPANRSLPSSKSPPSSPPPSSSSPS